MLVVMIEIKFTMKTLTKNWLHLKPSLLRILLKLKSLPSKQKWMLL